jgi:hypothetical protein
MGEVEKEVEKEVVDAVVDAAKEELTNNDKYEQKSKEMREKYADIINDLSVKYDKDLGVGFEMLKAIARANIIGEEPLYSTNIEFDLKELVEDYAVLSYYSNKCANQ